mmetsp:Transcript_17101/g.38654  ORF Transcript_17101/g.38654 Transcript_17101/m.38654 type:complete len:223 (+) Transcript_17101:404-1072(+)
MRDKTTSTDTMSGSGRGHSWSPPLDMRPLRGPVPRLSSAVTAYSSSGATRRRMGITSTTCLNSTSPGHTGRALMPPTSPAYARTTPASCTRPACTSSGGSTPGLDSRTCTSTALTKKSGRRSRPPATRRWAASGTPQFSSSQECLCLVGGTATIPWTTFMSSPWLQSTGTAFLVAVMCHLRGTVTAPQSTAAACSSSEVLTSDRPVSQTSVSSTSTPGRGPG